VGGDEPDNVVLVLLRRIDRTVAAHTGDLAEIRSRLGMLEEQYASLSRRLDRHGETLDRILRRLDLVEESERGPQ
jgi:hypothetical protein